MSVIVRFPPINPFRFAEADTTIPDRWGYPAFGTALQINATSKNQVIEPFFQKVATGDPVCIHYHRGRTGLMTGGANPSELRIFEVGTNTQLKVLGVTSSYTLSGITDKVTGEQLYTEQFLFIPSAIAELNDHTEIYMELWFYYPGDHLYKYRSNPISLLPFHEYTSLIEYNQHINGHDVLFEQLWPRFAYRIDSNGMIFEPGGDYTVFEAVDRSTVAIDAEAFNVFKWNLGGAEGLPEYMIDVINRSLQCCKDGYFRVDGREYVWQDGKMNNAGPEGKHLQWRTVTLKQKDEADGYTFAARKVQLFAIAAEYPFAIDGCAITDNFKLLAVHTAGNYCKVFDDEDGLDDWIADFNTLIVSFGYASVIEQDGDNVYVINAEGERFRRFDNTSVLPYYFQMGIGVGTAFTSFRAQLTYLGFNQRTVVVSPDTVSGNERVILSSNTSIGTIINIDENYGSTGLAIIRVFHNNGFNGFYATRSGAYSVALTGITGKISDSLETFRIEGHDMGAFNLSFLSPAKNTLRYFYAYTSNVTSIVTGWASALVSGTYKPYKVLGLVIIYGNKLTSTAVDNFINEFYNNVNWQTGMNTINLQANTPAAPPTGASNTARTQLAAHLWNVTTD